MRRYGALDIWLALYATVYGAWILLPMVDTFGTTAAFAGLRSLAPEWAWGAVICASGLFKLYSLWRGLPFLRRVALFWLFLLWSFLGWSVTLANVGSTAVPTYALVCLGYLYCYWRIGKP